MPSLSYSTSRLADQGHKLSKCVLDFECLPAKNCPAAFMPTVIRPLT